MWQAIVHLLEQYGIWGLLFTAFAESSFLPLAPDFFLIPMSLALPRWALWLALMTTCASICGAAFGYHLGKWIGKPLLKKLASRRTQARIRITFNRYGAGAIFVAALTPLPFKIFTISAGTFSMHLPRFLLAAVFGRGIRFFTEVLLIVTSGEEALAFLKSDWSWFTLLGVVVLIALGIIWASRRNHKATDTA